MDINYFSERSIFMHRFSLMNFCTDIYFVGYQAHFYEHNCIFIMVENHVTLYSIPMKPYIKGQYWMITTIPLDDNYFLVLSYHPV